LDLRDRLRRMIGEESLQPAEGPSPHEGKKRPLPGEEASNELGHYWIHRRDFSGRQYHGKWMPGLLEQVGADRLAVIAQDDNLKQFTPEEAVFIDTETTALGGGAGVYVFQAGLGFMQSGTFRVEQYFMRDFDEEPAMLFAMNERFRSFKAMVSFFGKNFDRYRLEDRMAALGIESALPVDCHLDLYHASRRLFKGQYPNLKLKTLEARRLGFERQGDLPGADCPEAFFQYLREGDSNRIIEVFEHNFWDILSLTTLTVDLDALMKEPASPLDRYGAGCLFMKAGDSDRAIALLEEAGRTLPEGPEAFDAGMRLVRLLKRRRDPKAGEKLKDLVEAYPENPESLLEMAKYQEHVIRDPAGALHYGEMALSCFKRWDDGSQGRARRIEEGHKRIERLKRKISRRSRKED
jgi:uncharacterized protein YprB with RNaseH-like and TPR domain